jgi:CubicO group peptidase (beta-lactamase class C family)
MRLERRDFLATTGAALAGTALGCTPPGRDELDLYFEERKASLHIPGVAGILWKGGSVLWSGSYGFADLEKQIPMGLDTIQNIASISKTFTATALMQLWELGKLQLDEAVDRYLPYPVRNPSHPGDAITFRHLLTHVSSIDDGTSYSHNYACGDPEISLADWIEGYFTPGGPFYDAGENFHDYRPGESYAYNNVAFGLLARLVEIVSGVSFPDYCSTHIFEPLGMTETSWFVAGLDPTKQAVPYTWRSEGELRGPTWGGEAQGVIGEGGGVDGFLANCLYNHPNYPDGFLRTSVRQLSRYLLAYLDGGPPILKKETVDEMLRVQSEEIWGLSWYARDLHGRRFWGHGGADPGVNTRIDLNREDGVGAIVFANTFMDSGAAEMRELNAKILERAYTQELS